MKADISRVTSIHAIPFLPIQFFKTAEVRTTRFSGETVFQSSGTASGNRSRHFVKSLSLYEKSFSRGFEYFYGAPEKFCILALLPSYLEKGNSSLVYMAADLVRQSKHPLSGFYLHDLEKLHSTILHNEIQQTPTLLLGVTYALLDFAASFPMKLEDTIVIETGGMKGRKEEMTRYQVHEILNME
jgi:hypothetical protein